MGLRFSTRVISLAALLPLLVVAVSGGLGYDRFRCTFTGAVTEGNEVGCCPAEDPPAQPIVTGASCCDHESARAVRAPAETASARVDAVAPRALAVGESLLLSPRTGGLPAPRAGAQAPPSPPLRLLKQSFLI